MALKLYEIWAIIIYIVYPVFAGLKDGVTFANRSRPYHELGYALRVGIVLLAIFYYWKLIIFIPVYAGYFWFLFDLSWCWSAHKPFTYVGSSAVLDKTFASKIWTAKFTVLIFGLILLFSLKNKFL